MLSLLALLAFLGPQAAPSASAAEPADPTLTLHFGEQTRSFKRSELLKRPDISSFHVAHDPSYKNKPTDYSHVIPLRPLFEGVPLAAGATLQFDCLDGFSASLSKDRVLGTDGKTGATPYLAIEGPEEKWPTTTDGGKRPGPYYLIWKDPEKSGIGSEEWPYALAGFTVKASVEATFPQIVPDRSLPENSPVRQGFNVFVKNCFACHTLNLAGQSKMGPDLNVPLSPTEYLSEANLKKLIRNPQNLRAWPESKMAGFSEAALPQKELTEVIAYLKSMAKHKVARPAAK
jgi:cytochrome c2